MVVAKDELLGESVGGGRLEVGDKVAGVEEEGESPVAFLLDDASVVAVVVRPGCGWGLAEALDASKGRVLNCHYGLEKY